MGKLIVFNLSSLNGFFKGPNNEIDWFTIDQEFHDFTSEQLNTASGLVFGRLTYDLMAAYWPTPMATQMNPRVAEKMNSLPKYVFSRKLKELHWENSQLLHGDISKEIQGIKENTDKNLLIFGSGNLCQSLITHGLIDEFRILINPIVLGKGVSMFPENLPPKKLALIHSRVFGNGNVLLSYTSAETE